MYLYKHRDCVFEEKIGTLIVSSQVQNGCGSLVKMTMKYLDFWTILMVKKNLGHIYMSLHIDTNIIRCLEKSQMPACNFRTELFCFWNTLNVLKDSYKNEAKYVVSKWNL